MLTCYDIRLLLPHGLLLMIFYHYVLFFVKHFLGGSNPTGHEYQFIIIVLAFCLDKWTIIFHSGYILMDKEAAEFVQGCNLHSTLVIFLSLSWNNLFSIQIYLHSTLVIFLLTCYFNLTRWKLNLHSTLVIFL